MINRDIKKPVEPQKPDITMPIFEESQEWNEYHEKKKQYDHDMELYDIKLKLLERMDSVAPVIMKCIGGTKEQITVELQKAGISLDESSIDKYLEAMQDLEKEVESHTQTLANIEEAEKRDTVGISFLNDKLKQSERIGGAERRKGTLIQTFAEESAVQVVIAEYEQSDFDTMRKVYEALKSLGYEGSMGGLEKFVPAFEQIASLEDRNADLEKESKQMRDKEQLLSSSNASLQEENETLREKNKRIIENVKNYKDFVLETVRNMPVIGKMLAKRIEKSEKSLGDGKSI